MGRCLFDVLTLFTEQQDVGSHIRPEVVEVFHNRRTETDNAITLRYKYTFTGIFV